MRGRLHWQIYLAFVGVVITCILLAGFAGHLFFAPLGTVPPHRPPHGGGLRLLWIGTVLTLGMALLTYPVARRIAGRLERLERGVERFGKGELSSRVEVEGWDEIADLARAFNRAADRIDSLVAQQKRVLAGASHELRAPLARLRMALELLLDPDTGPTAERKAALLSSCSEDIEELDALVGDVLLAARLENPQLERNFETIELWPLVRSEATRAGASVDDEAAEQLTGPGDARLLRRALRNLLENARKHGGQQVTVTLERSAIGACVRVSDDGAGIPEAERERIFEPFHRPQGHSEGLDGGVGLGLSLVRQVAARHGGSAHYRPREGGGSCFEIELASFT